MNNIKSLIKIVKIDGKQFSICRQGQTAWVKMNDLAIAYGLEHPSIWLSSEEGKNELRRVKDKTGLNYDQLIRVERGKTERENGTWCSHFHIAATYASMITLLDCIESIQGKRIPHYSTLTKEYEIVLGGIYSYQDVDNFIEKQEDAINHERYVFFEKIRRLFWDTTFFKHPSIIASGHRKDGAFIANGIVFFPVVEDPTEKEIDKYNKITEGKHCIFNNTIYIPEEYIKEKEG